LLKIGKKLVGKLWNATQFAAIHLNKLQAAPTTAKADMESGVISETIDRWILSRLGETVAAATEAFQRYEYADALDATNSFFWADFCDNYLELIKKRVYNEDGSASSTAQQSAVRALYYCLDGILKLYAPFTPHVTEELFSSIFANEYAQTGSLHARGQWPDAASYPQSAKDSADFYLCAGIQAKAILVAVRSEKSAQQKSQATPLSSLKIRSYHIPQRDPLLAISENDKKSFERDIAGTARAESFEWELVHTDNYRTMDTICVFAAEADVA
jgi:valyl-tRNA synthetase